MLKWPSNQHEKIQNWPRIKNFSAPSGNNSLNLLSLDTTLGLDGFLLVIVTIKSLILVCNQLTERLTDILLGIQS